MRLVAIVMGPTLPANIISTMTTFESVDNVGVIPQERPTVAKAETVSNNTAMKS